MTLLSNDDETNADGLSKSREKKIQRKQKRLQHMIADDTGIECCDQANRVNWAKVMSILRPTHFSWPMNFHRI